MKETSVILREQMERLSEASKRKAITPADLCFLSASMVRISRALFECNPMNIPHPDAEGRSDKAAPAAATLTTKTSKEIQWAEIKAAAGRGALKVGDEIRFFLKSGSPSSLTVADLADGRACLVFTDLVARRPMYESLPDNRVTWKGSDVRKWANEDFLSDLPDGLASIIIPRKIVQTVGGEVLETEDRLWAPSVTEMFGRKDWADCDGPDEAQFSLFKSERDRVKAFDGETWWYWLRSPYTGNATYFRIVDSGGTSYNYGASNSNGVCLGLYV